MIDVAVCCCLTVSLFLVLVCSSKCGAKHLNPLFKDFAIEKREREFAILQQRFQETLLLCATDW